MSALSCFSEAEFERAKIYLASQVAIMMGRKFEEGDWCRVYCAAKGLPDTGWSNLSIDVMYGNLGVEHKMLCQKSDQAIKAACGTTLMHPAGTRSIRIPSESDPTTAARIVLGQYADLINQRAGFVQIMNEYNNGDLERSKAAEKIAALYGMSLASASKLVPPKRTPVVNGAPTHSKPDMRTGWLLWQDSLQEFLYFEERTTPPNPDNYYAEWVDSGGGRRKKSRNLWVYDKETRTKKFSITTEAGAKIQPYFSVPTPDDPNLYYFRVQGEKIDDGSVRIWLTQNTAAYLRHLVGSLDKNVLSSAILEAAKQVSEDQTVREPLGEVAVPVIITIPAYEALKTSFEGVSDEHMVQVLIRSLGRDST
jgi:hypothetical protein